MSIVVNTIPPAVVAANKSRRERVLLGIALALLATSAYFIWRHFDGPHVAVETSAKRPLLTNKSPDFRDADVGLRFTPPPKWSMQLLSTEAPGDHRGDRMVVKFKRLLPNTPAAWFRVHVLDVSEDQAIADCVQKRDPGHDWKNPSAVSGLTVGGLAAAKIQYRANYNGLPSVREIIGVRRGGEVFFFVSTYQIFDNLAQEQTRQAMQTVLFEQQ